MPHVPLFCRDPRHDHKNIQKPRMSVHVIPDLEVVSQRFTLLLVISGLTHSEHFLTRIPETDRCPPSELGRIHNACGANPYLVPWEPGLPKLRQLQHDVSWCFMMFHDVWWCFIWARRFSELENAGAWWFSHCHKCQDRAMGDSGLREPQGAARNMSKKLQCKNNVNQCSNM